MSSHAAFPRPVSPQNPCPFLRALVGEGRLANGAEPLARVAAAVADAAHEGEGAPVLPRPVVAAIALVAHGLSPAALWRTQRRGVRLNGLRGGPLDKRGAGSRILDVGGRVDDRELARLATFATPQRRADGRTELGLRLADLRAFMDANFARAAGRRRAVDRQLMNGEWPVLLKVMGRDAPGGRYLALAEVDALFRTRLLPTRMRSKAPRRG